MGGDNTDCYTLRKVVLLVNNLTVFHNVQQGILSYMVEGACEDITRDTVDILREANLMARYGQILFSDH